MYRATLSFTTKDYDVRKNQILADDFTTQDEITEFLNIGYIVVYDDTLEITENGLYDVKDYENADVDVPSSEPILQSKDISINTNGTTTVTADTGYDALSDVDITVSGILDTSDATAVSSNIEKNKTAYVNGNTLTGNLKTLNRLETVGDVSVESTMIKFSGKQYGKMIINDNADVWLRASKSSVASAIGLVANKIKKDVTIIGVTGTYEGTKAVLPDIIKFQGSLATDFSWLADVDTSNILTIESMFSNCTSLVTIPIFDTSNVVTFYQAFNNCTSLSDDSLNNIMYMCIHSQARYKIARNIGISSSQWTRMQSLTNYDDFIAAGWSY